MSTREKIAEIVARGVGTMATTSTIIAALPDYDEQEAKLRNIVSHATAGSMQYSNQTTNDICVEITRTRNLIYNAGVESTQARIAELEAALIGTQSKFIFFANDTTEKADEAYNALEDDGGKKAFAVLKLEKT